MEHTGSPTVILAKTIKGYGLGEAGEGRNVTHQQKKLNEEEMLYFRRRFEIPIPEETVHAASFYKPPEDSPEMRYIHERREALGGSLPGAHGSQRSTCRRRRWRHFAESLAGSQRPRSLHHHGVRPRAHAAAQGQEHRQVHRSDHSRRSAHLRHGIAVPAVRHLRQPGPALQAGGQRELPVLSSEAKNGQILEEGITEAGSMASFTAAGTAYATYGVPMIPFFTYYSMFGFQRIGDLIWAFADSRGKGFLMGGTAGRTTLAGEGLQHQDGHSLVLASTVPTCHSYDPAYAYEIAVIIQDGIRRMYQEMEDRFYYLTIYNENYAQPPMPEGVDGRHPARHVSLPGRPRAGRPQVQLFGSGPILNEALRAQKILAEKYQVAADVWSVTSYNELRRDALEVERWNRLHPAEPERKPYLVQALGRRRGARSSPPPTT